MIPDMISAGVQIWRVRWPFIHIHIFRNICRQLCAGIVDRHVQSPMHLAESAAPPGSSRFQSSTHFGSRN